MVKGISSKIWPAVYTSYYRAMLRKAVLLR